MKVKFCFTKGIYVFFLLIFTTVGICYAGSWKWYRGYHPRKDIVTLVITGNYTKPRGLADLIQIATRQPYILLPAKGQSKIFFVPYKHAALEIREKNLARFIKFIHPKQIIVLGDKRYVPQKYLNMIDPKQTVIMVKNEDWNKSAQTIGNFLDISFLADDFKDLIQKKIEAGELYRPAEIKFPGSGAETTEELPEAIDMKETKEEITIGEPPEENPVLVPDEKPENKTPEVKDKAVNKQEKPNAKLKEPEVNSTKVEKENKKSELPSKGDKATTPVLIEDK